jgi:hypothetical protein
MPYESFHKPTSIEPMHLAMALCDWIGNRTTTLEAPDVLSDAGWKNAEQNQNALLAHDSRNLSFPRRNPSAAIGLAALAVATIAGCSQSQLPVYPVSGQVAYEDEIPHGALVVLHPLSNELKVRPRGEVDSAGRFQIGTYSENDGAPAGEYFVTITWNKYIVDAEDYKPGPNVLPEMYADAATSPLTIEVNEVSNQLPPFVLSRCDAPTVTVLTPDI